MAETQGPNEDYVRDAATDSDNTGGTYKNTETLSTMHSPEARTLADVAADEREDADEFRDGGMTFDYEADADDDPPYLGRLL